MSDLQIYADYMAVIRDRVSTVQTIMAGRMSTGHKDMDAELIFTQFRKIAEGLAYSLLAANKIEYCATHSDISTLWKAKELIKRLSVVNPDFYPVGLLEPLVNIPGFRHFPRVPDGYLTKDDFSVLYQGSSGVLHVRNPYSTKGPHHQRQAHGAGVGESDPETTLTPLCPDRNRRSVACENSQRRVGSGLLSRGTT